MSVFAFVGSKDTILSAFLKGNRGYSKFEVESSAFLNEKKNLISNFEVENCYNPILRNFALWLKTANVIASWNLLNTCIDTE